jgi:tRNA nucleotidyltransferase (CCA-adding enzyme)
MQVYLVGGAVRDSLLGLPVKERDWVVVGASREQMLSAGYREVGRDFPVFLHPQTHEEYALARIERKTAPGYRGFDVQAGPAVTLEEDLSRRDLTINAIAQDASGACIDPFGGQADIQSRLLRHVSPAFVEDPVRVLRVARFAARFASLGFRIAPETLELMRRMVDAGEIDALVAERVWAETAKALAEKTPAEFFRVLRDCGALRIVYPELDALFGVPQPPQWHPEIDTGLHTLMVLEAAAALTPDICVRFAALVHDLGKGATPRSEWPKHYGHEHRSVELIETMCARLRVPGPHRELAVLVARYHGIVHKVSELKASTLLEMLEKTDAFRRPQRFADMLLACEADARGRTGFESRPYPQREWLLRAAATAAAIKPDAAMTASRNGEEIAKQLRQVRLKALSDLKKSDA